jgi:hypothetical protein
MNNDAITEQIDNITTAHHDLDLTDLYGLHLFRARVGYRYASVSVATVRRLAKEMGAEHVPTSRHGALDALITALVAQITAGQ